MAKRNQTSAANLKQQLTVVQDLSKSISSLTTAFIALNSSGASYSEIQKELGKRLEAAYDNFRNVTKEADALAVQTSRLRKPTEEQITLLGKLQTAIGVLGSKYSTLSNKDIAKFNKAQEAYSKIVKEQEEITRSANRTEQEILKTRRLAAKTALAEAELRIRLEREASQKRESALKKEVSDLNKTESEKTKIRKRGFAATIKNFENEQKANEKLVASQEKLYARLKKANDKRIEQERIASEKLAESRKFFGKSFSAAFSPESIGKAIGSVTKFIGVFQILNKLVEVFTGLTVGSIKAFIDFDASISKVAAVSGASGVELNNLSEAIRQSAVDTRFSANEIAELSVSLAKLGISAKEIPSLIQPITIAAQATGENLTSVGEAIIKVTNQFQLGTSAAATTAAVLTAAVNESSLSLESFNVAIGYVGPLANQAGLSFEETAKALGILSDSGFSASRAGTGLRTILTNLKKPGVDLIDTLQELADKNIGVQEAQKLVGKQGAAQLITLTQNIEKLKEVTLVEEGYASQLNATAQQMSSLTGQIDILAGAYTELQLKIGNFLTSNNLLIEAIGVLDEDAENLARGYKLLSEESLRLGDTFEARLAKGLRDGASSFEILKDILKDTKDQRITEIVKDLEDAGAASMSIEELNEQLSGLRSRYEFLAAFDPRKFGARRSLESVISAQNLLEKTVKDSELNKFLEAGTRRVNERYSAEVMAIGKVINEKEREAKAINASSKFLATANKLEKEALDLRAKDAKVYGKQASFLEGSAKGYRLLAAELSGYTYTEKQKEKVVKDPTDRYKEQFNLLMQNFELERKGIEDSQKDAEKAFKARMKQIEDEFSSKEKAASTESELIEVLAQKRSAEKQVIDSYNEELGVYADKTADLTTRSAEFFDNFTSKFKGSAENTQNLINKLEGWSQAIANLAQQNSELNLEAQLTVVKEAAILYEDGGKAIDLFSSRLKDLESQFDKTKYGQINLSIAQKKYIQDIRNDLAKSLEDYNKRFAALSLVIGEDAAKKILQPFADVSDSLVKKLNEAIKNGTLDDKTIAEIKKKLVSLRGTIEDGVGKDDVILNIDITPQEIIAAALDETLKAIDRFNDAAFENTKNRLDRELDEIKYRAEVEDDILQAKLEGQLISDAEYRAQVDKNRRKEAQAQNRIEKQMFDAQQKRDRQQALFDYLEALGSIVPTLIKRGEAATPLDVSLKAAITAGFATVGYGLELRAINQRKFYPTKFAEGGIVNGPSHAEGGVPFTVRGQGGYEMEGGEYIINKKSTQKYKTLLDQINGYGKSNYKFAAGGVVKDPTEVANRQIELLEAIASSNISMVGKLDKPVRAFVASNDLRSDENARRIQERNSQL